MMKSGVGLEDWKQPQAECLHQLFYFPVQQYFCLAVCVCVCACKGNICDDSDDHMGGPLPVSCLLIMQRSECQTAKSSQILMFLSIIQTIYSRASPAS